MYSDITKTSELNYLMRMMIVMKMIVLTLWRLLKMTRNHYNLNIHLDTDLDLMRPNSMMRTSSGNTEQVRNVLHVQILSATFIRSQGSSSLLRPLTWRWWGRSRSHSTARSQDTSEDNYQVTKNQRNLAESSKTKSSEIMTWLLFCLIILSPEWCRN